MLKSELLLFALNDMKDSDLESARARLGYKIGGVTGQIVKKRIITLALAAALILGLGVTAYAIGMNIHRQRQEELRRELQIDENNVTDYTEYQVPEDEASDGGLTLLSTINNGDYQEVFFNISPVTEEMLALLDQETADKQVYWPYLYVDGEYYGILVDLYGRYSDNYDPNAETLTLQASIPNLRFIDKEKVEIRVTLGYTSDDAQIRACTSYGPAFVALTRQRMRSLHFTEPIFFENPETGGMGQIIGADITAESITWMITHDDMETVYPINSENNELWLPWARARDKIEYNAQIHFADGSVKTALAAQRSEYWNGTVYDVCLFPDGMIDLDQVVSITINGQTFPLE